MKLIPLLDEKLSTLSTDVLQHQLLQRAIKVRKLNKECNENAIVQKAYDALNAAKAPFKKAKSKWLAEIEAIELELKSRNIKYNVVYDDIFEGE